MALYLEMRANEPCGHSVPTSVYKTLMFMEHAAEMDDPEMLYRSEVLKNTLEEVNLKLAEGAESVRRQASLILVSVVASMERLVMDRREAEYPRAYAWYKLVKIWSRARFSDTTGMPWATVGWDSDGFIGSLTRTKTTGPESGFGRCGSTSARRRGSGSRSGCGRGSVYGKN